MKQETHKVKLSHKIKTIDDLLAKMEQLEAQVKQYQQAYDNIHDSLVRYEVLYKELIEALQSAKLQIEYLEEKYPKTGTSMQVLAMINHVLNKAKEI
jgi:multidrug resistance efflux pump